MSWIKDVKYELNKLDFSKKSLKKFGLTIGAVFIITSIVFHFIVIYFVAKIILISLGLLLVLMGYVIPVKLRSVYKIWMGLAFVLGWFVSRFLLSILFVFILTPISFIAKIVNKKFLDLSYKKKSNISYWVSSKNISNNYEKMY